MGMLRDPTLTLPTSLPNDAPLVSICINDAWRVILLSVLERLEYLTTWVDGTTYDQLDIAINQLYHEIITSGGAMGDNCCDSNLLPFGTQFRVSQDGVVQASQDGGASWQDAPLYDPRLTSAQYPRLPGEPSDTIRCAAAANATEWIRHAVDDIVDQAGTIAGLIAVIGLLIIELLSLGGLTAFVIPMAASLFALTGSGVAAAFGEDVYDSLRCVIYCRMDNEGRMSTIEGIVDDLEAEGINGTAVMVLQSLFLNIGALGVTNAGTIGSADGTECGDCGCDCVTTEDYDAFGAAWSGGLETTDGSCGLGHFVGDGTYGAATFTIPNRDGRLVVGVSIPVCDGTSGGGWRTVVTVGGVGSDQGALLESGTHTFATPQDSDTVVITTNAGYAVFFAHVYILYEC